MKKELIEKFNKLLDEINNQLNDEDEFNEFHKALAIRQNKDNIDKFSKVEFSRRIIILPQCLRNSSECIAEEKGYMYICRKCGKCTIAKIIEKAEELRYQGVFVVKGGKAPGSASTSSCGRLSACSIHGGHTRRPRSGVHDVL